MKAVTIQLHLKGYCIEKAAKNEFRRLMADCFALPGSSIDPVIVLKLELLREFLDKKDFKNIYNFFWRT